MDSKISYHGDSEYIDCQEDLNKIYQEKTNKVIIRVMFEWYEHQEKLSRIFLNLGKKQAMNFWLRAVIHRKYITEEKEINKGLYNFNETPFQPKQNIVSKSLIHDYLHQIEIHSLCQAYTNMWREDC